MDRIGFSATRTIFSMNRPTFTSSTTRKKRNFGWIPYLWNTTTASLAMNFAAYRG